MGGCEEGWHAMAWRDSAGDVRRIAIKTLFAGQEVTELDTLADLRHRECDYPRALLYATLLLPELCVIEGRVIRVDGIDKWDDVEQLRSDLAFGGERARTAQESVNRLEVGYMFSNPRSCGADLTWVRILGDAIVAAWTGWLKVEHPGKSCIVAIENGGESDDWEELSVTFWQD